MKGYRVEGEAKVERKRERKRERERTQYPDFINVIPLIWA